MRKLKVFLSALLITVASAAFAQNITVTGVVTDASNGEPLSGAAVLVKGTPAGTVADIDGRYSISVSPDATLGFTTIGFKDVEIEVQGRTEINASLEPDTELLDEVVVTAMGISRAEKTLGYSATTVKSDEIVGARTTNAVQALSGKVAGVQVLASSSDPGAATNIIIRGFSSISGSNQPLYVVDGVPIQNSSLSSASGDKSSSIAGISNIASSDIESMTILKGAAATALYGSRAANGVIIVTTRSGKKGDGRNFSLEYTGGMQLRQVSQIPMFQNEFGQGWNGTQTFIENGSWGPRLDGSTQVYGPIWNHQQRIHNYDAKVNNFIDFFELGISHNHNVTFSGASNDDKLTYFLSYSYNKDNGIMPGDHDSYKRNTIAFRSSYQATKWMKVSSSINFARAESRMVDTDQGTSVIDGLYEFPRDMSIVDLKDLSNPFNTPEAYLTPYGITNPYWALENNYDNTESKQLNGKIQADFTPVKGLTLTYRMGFDYTNYNKKVGYPQIALDDALINDDKGYAPSQMNQNGWVSRSFGELYETNHDFLATYTNNFGKFSLTALAGVNINERGSSAMAGKTSTLTFDTGFWDLSNGADKTSISESASKRRLTGVFADVTVGWNDEVFLDVTARNDWSSTLPITANHYFYPGATLSWIFSNRFAKNNVLSFGKIRLAYGKTGNDAGVYRTNITYTPAYADGTYAWGGLEFPLNGVNSFVAAASKGSSTLRPEMTSEFEVGANLQFFNGRIGIDAAYYNRKTSDQIFSLPVDPSTGYNSIVTNFGDITNKGVELVLNTTPVQTRDFRWDLNFNWSKNNNLVESLPDGLDGGKSTIQAFAAGDDAVYVYAEVGKPMGEFYTYLPKKDAAGHTIVGNDGYPVLETELKDTGKNFQSDWTGGVNTSISWKGFTLSAVLDVRYGGYMFSRTKNLMQFTGNGIATLYNGREPFIIPGSVYEDGTPNTTPIFLNNQSYQNYFSNFGAGEGGEFYLLSRTSAKLRNVSLTWDVPKKWMNRIKFSGASISVFCNNVFTWTPSDNYYIDPETSSYSSSGDLAAQFGELYSNPACRVWGFSANIKF
ncbi:MAG: SusC/RagA family TonB-linked outer membrane protein [Bacteroidaceae bacterium]|nr:SusC/RagA family TonB-linked outer membrane protein [Bacteroidaceae bacterium]